VVDRDRLLARLDQMDGYLAELRAVAPARLDEYKTIEKRRACERLLQILVEAVIDVCSLLVSGLRLGLPGDEDDLFQKLRARAVLSEPMTATVRRMKGLRNLLVHEYARVDDEIVFETIRHGLADFEAFKREVLDFLRRMP
jgi:uncharacterized protein YutE (UPF0331/DUF86 family)